MGPSCYPCYPRPSGPCFTGTIPSGGRAQAATPSATLAATLATPGGVGRQQNTEYRVQNTEINQGAKDWLKGRSTALAFEQCFAPTRGRGLGNGNRHAGSVNGGYGEGRQDSLLLQYSTEIGDNQRVFWDDLKVLIRPGIFLLFLSKRPGFNVSIPFIRGNNNTFR